MIQHCTATAPQLQLCMQRPTYLYYFTCWAKQHVAFRLNKNVGIRIFWMNLERFISITCYKIHNNHEFWLVLSLEWSQKTLDADRKKLCWPLSVSPSSHARFRFPGFIFFADRIITYIVNCNEHELKQVAVILYKNSFSFQSSNDIEGRSRKIRHWYILFYLCEAWVI